MTELANFASRVLSFLARAISKSDRFLKVLSRSAILAKIVDFFERRGDEPYNIGRDIRSGVAKRLPTGEIEYKKTRQKKGAVKPPVNQP